MGRQIIRIGLAVLWALTLTLGQLTYAETRVLLVGVSGYPSLPEHRRLRGPANDVQIMRAGLLKAGVTANQIRILADGAVDSSALPTRQAILDSMRMLAEQARPKDWVIVYFSGHGSQQPQLPGKHAYTEPDGLDEIFLPYDIGKWDGSKMAVQGALIDDEIGHALEAISRKGASIWAIFDTCHAGGMAKAALADCSTDGCPVTRFVSPSALGVPEQSLHQAKPGRTKPTGTAARMPNNTGTGTDTNNPVFFFASQKDEPAAEEPLPDPLGASGAPKRYFGLFTYLLAQALPNWSDDLGALASHIAQRYKARPYPTPLFEGALSQTPDFFAKQQIGAKKSSTPP